MANTGGLFACPDDGGLGPGILRHYGTREGTQSLQMAKRAGWSHAGWR